MLIHDEKGDVSAINLLRKAKDIANKHKIHYDMIIVVFFFLLLTSLPSLYKFLTLEEVSSKDC